MPRIGNVIAWVCLSHGHMVRHTWVAVVAWVDSVRLANHTLLVRHTCVALVSYADSLKAWESRIVGASLGWSGGKTTGKKQVGVRVKVDVRIGGLRVGFGDRMYRVTLV